MAQGDLTMFEEALAYMLDGGWEAADNIKVALVTNSPLPAAATAEPGLAASAGTTLTECAGGTYAAQAVCSWGTFISEAGGTVTADDDSVSVTFSQDASSGPTNAYYAIVYNDSDGSKKRAICMIDLGGQSSLQAGDIVITWNGSGIFTIS